MLHFRISMSLPHKASEPRQCFSTARHISPAKTAPCLQFHLTRHMPRLQRLPTQEGSSQMRFTAPTAQHPPHPHKERQTGSYG